VSSRFLVASALVLVLAASFAAVGYAYTATTENSGNTATSEYVVLTQQNYTFTNNDLRFDVIDTDGGKVYQLLGGYNTLITIDGKVYYGMVIGQDTLTATKVGGTGNTIDIEVSSENQQNGWFTDYGDTLYDWRYILEIKDTSEQKQYAYYSGSLDGVWKYQVGGVSVEKLTLTLEENYTTTLYFAGVGVNTSASLRSEDSQIKLTSSINISPVWKPLSNAPNGLVKCVFECGEGATGEDRIVYLEKGSDLILPGNNMFTHNSKQFVGWLDSGNEASGLTLMPFYTFSDNEKDHTFIAQWSSTYKTVTINNDVGIMVGTQHVLEENSYTLPLCGTNKANNFNGWTVTATDGEPIEDYSKYKNPYTNIQNIREDITLTPSWGESNTKKVKIQDGGVDKFILDPDSEGLLNIPYCLFGPPESLDDPGFIGWEFVGWSVWNKNTRIVAQSYTMPVGNEGCIIKNGTIKFAYDNGLENGQE